MNGSGPGEVLNGRYELLERIGGGSMGEVWRGRDLALGRTVAVKIVLPSLMDAPTFLERFAAEARVMAMIDHPGVVGVFDYGYTPSASGHGTAFLVMEFIEGESLDRVLSRLGPLEPGFVLEALASLLDALSAVHRQGVVHRDVKPGNVMLRAEGVVLADFGVARSPESLGLTAADKLMGTVPYLAPELFRSEAATPAADIYAVGILGYELLDGRPPFHSESTAGVMYQHVHEPMPPLPHYVPDEVSTLLERALAKKATDRWPDAAAMAAAVRAVLAGDSVPEWERDAVEPVMRRSGGGGGRHGSGEPDLDLTRVDGSDGRQGSGESDLDRTRVEAPEAASASGTVSHRRGGRHGAGEIASGDARTDETVVEGAVVLRRAGGGSGGSGGSGGHGRGGPSHGEPAGPGLVGNRKALIPVLGGVAAVALAIVVVVASQGSGSPGQGGRDAGQQPPGVTDTASGLGGTSAASPYESPTHSRGFATSTGPGGHTSPKTSASPSGSTSPTGRDSSTPTASNSPSTGPSTHPSGTVPSSSGPTTTPSSSPSATAPVPNVVNDTPADAHAALQSAGFQWADSPSNPTGSCHVTNQNPGPSASAVVGSTVTLDITCS